MSVRSLVRLTLPWLPSCKRRMVRDHECKEGLSNARGNKDATESW
jgi:hypothetical protein